MAKSSSSTRRAERAGRWLANRYRVFARQEERFVRWAIEKQLPLVIARGFIWLLRLAVVAALAYATFWLALVVGLLWFCALALQNGQGDELEEAPQWREGLDGHGLYRGDVRIDPGGGPDD
ncbi:DUF3742 family protein [Pseudomonas aeruginosa]